MTITLARIAGKVRKEIKALHGLRARKREASGAFEAGILADGRTGAAHGEDQRKEETTARVLS